MYITNTILYIVKKRELRETAPEGCCLTLSNSLSLFLLVLNQMTLHTFRTLLESFLLLLLPLGGHRPK